MSNIEPLYDTLQSLTTIQDKEEPIVLSPFNQIITVTKFFEEKQAYIDTMASIDETAEFPADITDCQRSLQDRIITLELPLPNKDQLVTAKFLEANIIAKFADEYQKSTDLLKEEITTIINNVLAENTKLKESDIFVAIVHSKVADYKKAKQAKAVAEALQSRNEHLLNQIRKEFNKIKITRQSNKLFSLNIEQEMEIIKNSSKVQLEEILALLQEQSQKLQFNDNILAIEYNCLPDSAKNKVTFDKFKEVINTLITSGYNLEISYKTTSDIANNSNSSTEFDQEIATIVHSINYMDENAINNYNHLSYCKKQFITQFQFEQAVKHIFYLGFDYVQSIKKVLEIATRNNEFNSFHSNVYYMHASADETSRGYGTKIHVTNVYNEAREKLDDAGILPLFVAENISLKEEQAKRSFKDFQKWVNNLANTQITATKPDVPTFASSNILEAFSNNIFLGVENEYASLTSVRDQSIRTDSKKISLSSMFNFGNTCWLNASLKFIYSFYGYHELKLAIQNKLFDVKKQPTVELQEKLHKLLKSVSVVIDAMVKNENINIQTVKFLTCLHDYAVALPQGHPDKENIDYINNRLVGAFNNSSNIDVSKIEQQDADEFISPFIYFLKLNSESSMLAKKNFRTYTFAKKDLATVSINISKSQLIFETKPLDTETGRIVKLPEAPTSTTDPLDITYFRDYFTSAKHTNASNEDKQLILNNALDVSDKTKITTLMEDKDKLFANINKLQRFPLNNNHGIKLNESDFRDINRIKAELVNMFPSIKLEVIDTETNQPYLIEAVAETMVLFWGNRGTVGHYSTVSIAENGEIFMQNDMMNTTIEYEYDKRVADNNKLERFIQNNTQEKLLEYMELSVAYPTNVGFRVISKTPINQ